MKTVLNGPSPTLVAAAMMHLYVVNGLRVVTVIDVVIEVSWNSSPVSTADTLMVYSITIPFLSSALGGSHVRTADREDVELAEKLWGYPEGSVGKIQG